MQAIAKPHQQFALIYLSSMAEGDNYLKELGKSWRETEEALSTVEVDSVLDIFLYILYDI